MVGTWNCTERTSRAQTTLKNIVALWGEFNSAERNHTRDPEFTHLTKVEYQNYLARKILKNLKSLELQLKSFIKVTDKNTECTEESEQS